MESPGLEVILGMDVITQGDFSITNLNGNTVFSFRVPSLHRLDYVAEINSAKKQYLRRQEKKQKRKTKRRH